ncbi:MAG: hypothetical protein HYU66_00300 [Armatimonadetes bacterium]|nr:hypothetical protein [Armatimonadota bacterium]
MCAEVLERLTVLDPTCGEGAFLLAAQRLITELLDGVPDSRANPMPPNDGRGGVSPPVCGPGYQPGHSPGDGWAEEPCAGGDSPQGASGLYGVDLSAAVLEVCRERLGGAARLHHGNAVDDRVAWLRAFPEVFERGGFDIILGNPPFLEARQVAFTLPPGHRTVHGACLERCRELLQPAGRLGLVMPLALVATRRLAPARERLEAERSTWYANFAWRPAGLFPDVNRPITLLLAGPRQAAPRTYTTGYRKWTAATRPLLLPTLAYVAAPRLPGVPWVPKLGDPLEPEILRKLLGVPERLGEVLSTTGARRIWYRTTGGLYWKVFTDFAPEFSSAGVASASSRQTSVGVAADVPVEAVIAALSSHIYWWWYSLTSTCRDNNPADLAGFPVPGRALADPELARLGREYLDGIAAGSRRLVREQRQTGHTVTQSFVIRRSKPVLDAIGRVLATHYGFTDAEAECIECYDIKFRLGATAR